jgi:hypothetical protein
MSGKGLITKIYKESKNLMMIRIKNPLNKCTNGLNSQFLKQELQMVNKYMKKCSTSLPTKEM